MKSSKFFKAIAAAAAMALVFCAVGCSDDDDDDDSVVDKWTRTEDGETETLTFLDDGTVKMSSADGSEVTFSWKKSSDTVRTISGSANITETETEDGETIKTGLKLTLGDDVKATISGEKLTLSGSITGTVTSCTVDGVNVLSQLSDEDKFWESTLDDEYTLVK